MSRQCLNFEPSRQKPRDENQVPNFVKNESSMKNFATDLSKRAHTPTNRRIEHMDEEQTSKALTMVIKVVSEIIRTSMSAQSNKR